VKVIENTLVITKVDKGKTLVILEKEECHNKVMYILFYKTMNVQNSISVHLMHTRKD